MGLGDVPRVCRLYVGAAVRVRRGHLGGARARAREGAGAARQPVGPPRGPVRDPVSAAEVAAMAAVVKDAVAAGAIGFSTSRTLLHRDKSGLLIPGTLAGAEEMVALGRAVAEGGGGVLEMASDLMAEDDAPSTAHNLGARLSRFAREWLWMHRVSHEYKVPLCVCLGIPSQSTPGQNGFRYMLDQVAAARADGCEMHVQVFLCSPAEHPHVLGLAQPSIRRVRLVPGAQARARRWPRARRSTRRACATTARCARSWWPRPSRSPPPRPRGTWASRCRRARTRTPRSATLATSTERSRRASRCCFGRARA